MICGVGSIRAAAITTAATQPHWLHRKARKTTKSRADFEKVSHRPHKNRQQWPYGYPFQEAVDTLARRNHASQNGTVPSTVDEHARFTRDARCETNLGDCLKGIGGVAHSETSCAPRQ